MDCPECCSLITPSNNWYYSTMMVPKEFKEKVLVHVVSQYMPRTKGSKNCATTSVDFDAQIKKLQKDKAMLEEGLSKTVAQIEELKTDIKSLREGLNPQKAKIKQTEKEIAKLEAKKSAAEAKAAEAAKKVEAEAMLKKLLASGMSADEILEKLK